VETGIEPPVNGWKVVASEAGTGLSAAIASLAYRPLLPDFFLRFACNV